MGDSCHIANTPTGNGILGALSLEAYGEELPTPHENEKAEQERFKELYAGVEFYDDVNGGPLGKDLMTEARKFGMKFFNKHGHVYQGGPE